MKFLAKVTSGPQARPIRVLCYGVPKVGKSTWAAGAPNPIFLDGEEGTLKLPVDRIPIQSWDELSDALRELVVAEHDYQTVVIDTLDAFERMLTEHLIRADNRNRRGRPISSVEEIGGGYGKGWTAVVEEWQRLFPVLDALHRRGMGVIALAHAGDTTFSDPDGDSWARWEPLINKKSRKAWVGYVDDVLFATRETNRDRRTGKGTGDERVLRTDWAPGREAGSRSGLPSRLPLRFEAFEAAMKRGQPVSAKAPEPEPDPAIDRLRGELGQVVDQLSQRGALSDQQATAMKRFAESASAAQLEEKLHSAQQKLAELDRPDEAPGDEGLIDPQEVTE